MEQTEEATKGQPRAVVITGNNADLPFSPAQRFLAKVTQNAAMLWGPSGRVHPVNYNQWKAWVLTQFSAAEIVVFVSNDAQFIDTFEPDDVFVINHVSEPDLMVLPLAPIYNAHLHPQSEAPAHIEQVGEFWLYLSHMLQSTEAPKALHEFLNAPEEDDASEEDE